MAKHFPAGENESDRYLLVMGGDISSGYRNYGTIRLDEKRYVVKQRGIDREDTQYVRKYTNQNW